MNVMRLQKQTKFLDAENDSDDADAEDSEAMVLDDDEEDAEVSPEYMEFIRKTEEHRKQSRNSPCRRQVQIGVSPSWRNLISLGKIFYIFKTKLTNGCNN